MDAPQISVIGQEAVGELAKSVGVKQGRTDRPELGGRKNSSVDQRLLTTPIARRHM